VARIPADVLGLLDDLFRAKFTAVRRFATVEAPSKALPETAKTLGLPVRGRADFVAHVPEIKVGLDLLVRERGLERHGGPLVEALLQALELVEVPEAALVDRPDLADDALRAAWIATIPGYPSSS
jgi:hypothetical protein